MTQSRVSDSHSISHYKNSSLFYNRLVVYYSNSGLENFQMHTRIFFANIIGNSLKQPSKCPSVVKQIHKLCECVSIQSCYNFFFILIHFIVYTIVTCEFTELFPWQTRQKPVNQGKQVKVFMKFEETSPTVTNHNKRVAVAISGCGAKVCEYVGTKSLQQLLACVCWPETTAVS